MLLNIADEALVKKSKNIDFYMQIKSLESTANYVEKNFRNAKKFNNKTDLLKYAVTLTNNPGLFCEFGVYRGESIRLIANQIKPRRIHGFDSFEGLPIWWRDGFEKSAFSLNGQMPEVPGNVSLHKGLFDETLPDFTTANNDKISFLHIDCDLYSSTKTIFSFLKPRLEKGTIIVFDEYFNYPTWEQHEFKAFQELVKDSGINYEYIAYNTSSEQAVVILT
jgi:predicted O-methyltransferase YrrM